MPMKNFFPLSIAIVALAFVSCQKEQSEADKNAEIERQVQQRLAAEHQADQEKTLAERETNVAAREKALADQDNAATATPPERERGVAESYESGAREPRDAGPSRGYSTFYTKLEGYGDWIETGDYGYVFHPREAESSRNWRPYTNGRWVYTDVGWTWVSEEPFGWATYHYGRWVRLRHIGWVWTADSEWAPAWVSWRKNDDYIGWAPLPPEAHFHRRAGIRNWADNYYDIGPDQYCFVPATQFGAQRVLPTIVSAERNLSIVSQTTNVTNITYNNTSIVNQGPDYYELRARTQQPIEHLRVVRRTILNFLAEDPHVVIKGEVI